MRPSSNPGYYRVTERRAPALSSSRAVRAWLLGVPIAVIGIATLVPSQAESVLSWRCIACGYFGVADAVANVILFAPLGATAALIGWNLRLALVAGASLSLIVELAQIFIPGREVTIGDVLFNTIGTAFGVALVRSARWWLRPRAQLAASYSLAAAVFVVGVLGLTAVLVQPDFPQAKYWGQWTAKLGGLEWYRGRVVGAKLGDLPIPSWELEDSDSARALLLAGAQLNLRVIAGPQVPSLAPILGMADDRQRQIFLLGVDRNDLVFSYRTRASALRLNQPYFRVPGALEEVSTGDTLIISVARKSQRYCLALNGKEKCDLGPTLGSGWALLAHLDSTRSRVRALLSAAWVSVLLLPFGFWARRRVESVLGALLIIGGLFIIPQLVPLMTTRVVEYVGAGCGFVIGLALQRPVRGIRG